MDVSMLEGDEDQTNAAKTITHSIPKYKMF
jgi:hypothetical protein